MTSLDAAVDNIPFAEFYADTKKLISPRKFQLEPLSRIKPSLEGSYLIKGLLSSTGLAVIYGASMAGKSFVAIVVGLCISSGLPFAGRKVRRAGVIYVGAEGQAGLRKRVYAARRELGIIDAPFGLITVAPNLGTAEGDVQLLIREVREQMDDHGIRPGLIVLDTVARTIVGIDENSSRDMGVFVANAEAIGRALGACVLAVHHTGKGGSEKGMRGSSALHGAADAEWEIASDETGKSIRIVKMKDGETGTRFMFRLRVVEVGTDEDGDPVTTCFAEVSDEPEQANVPADRGTRKLAGQKAEFIKAVGLAIESFGEIMPASEHVPRNRKGVTRQKFAHYAEQLGFTDGATAEARKTVRNRLIRTLAGDGYLRQWGEWLWLPS